MLPLAIVAALQRVLTVAGIPSLIGMFAIIMQASDILFTSFNPLVSPVENFDFIVVGAGSAGAAIAAKLSEDSSVSVLLLEAGGDPNPLTYVPATAQYLSHRAIDWQYVTVPQNGSALASKNQEMPWPRGKSVGGSSNLNFMIYNRGNKKDFDRWAEITGDLRWSFDSMVQYFLKIEDYYGNWLGEGIHNQGGPLRIEPLRYGPLVDPILNAAAEYGFPVNDPNTIQTQGFSPLDFTMKRGTRFSTYRAYITPAKKRPNFHIYRYALATKILFAEELELRAIGVSYIRHGVESVAYASKEVIISAGTVASPQLLMLSGIGPMEHLLHHGIHPILDLPGVGKGLQDHVCTFVGPFLVNKPESYIPERDLNSQAILSYLKDGSGPLSLPYGVVSFGFGATSSTPPDWPNIIWAFQTVGMHRTLHKELNFAFNTPGDLFKPFLFPHIGQDGFFVRQCLGLPKSSGYIALYNNNPLFKPMIDPRYYAEYEDVNSMIEGIETLLGVVETTKSLGQDLGARLSPVPVPGCELYLHRSREYWECVIRTLTTSLFHPAGTCRMGMVHDPLAVVDSHLKVRGVEGLRVADASVMPKVTNANLNAPAIVVGEMCADMIKETWGLGLS